MIVYGEKSESLSESICWSVFFVDGFGEKRSCLWKREKNLRAEWDLLWLASVRLLDLEIYGCFHTGLALKMCIRDRYDQRGIFPYISSLL